MVLQARLRLKHFGCISERVTGGARVTHMNSDGVHCVSVFRATSPRQLAELLQGNRHLMEEGGPLDGGEDWAVARCHCPRKGSRILPLIEASGCSVLSPMIEEDGHEFYTLLVPARSMLRDLLKRLEPEGQVVVEGLREMHGLTLDLILRMTDVTARLTKKQLGCLEQAVAGGYYERPRKTSLQLLAKENRMARSTFQEHLQKAEAVVVSAFIGRLANHPARNHLPANGRGRPPVQGMRISAKAAT